VPVEENNEPVAIVQIAQSLDSVEDILQRLLITLLVSVPLLVAIAGFGGYFLAVRALAPIDRITRMARRISAEDLSARLNMPVIDDEVGRLAETFDAMLARLDDSFRRERQFTSDASHELRTPLTAMQAILGMIRKKQRTPEEYGAAWPTWLKKITCNMTENLLQQAERDAPPPYHETIELSTLYPGCGASVRSAEGKRHWYEIPAA
jgi:signal transduction histidine kinase